MFRIQTKKGEFVSTKLEETTIKDIRLLSTNELFYDKNTIFEIECSKLVGNVNTDLQASNLFFVMNANIGEKTKPMTLEYKPWWNSYNGSSETICEKWVRIYQQHVVWNSDITYFFPNDLMTFRIVLARYYACSLGAILDAICELNNESQCCLFHHGYIVMSYVGSDEFKKVHLHQDFKPVLDKCYTVLLPVDLPFNQEPQLVLQGPLKRNEEPKLYHYKIRKNVGLGFNGGFVHASNSVGKMNSSRIMLGLFVGNIDHNLPNDAKAEVMQNIWGYFREKMTSVRQVNEWMDGPGKYVKGSTEYLYSL